MWTLMCVKGIELLDIECMLCHVAGVQFDKTICPMQFVPCNLPLQFAILDFLQKLPFAFAQNVLGRANFAPINLPFCGNNFLTDTRWEPAFYVYYFYGQRSCIVIMYYCFHTGPYRSLQQISNNNKNICYYLHFGKLQSNTITERIPKISTN